MKKIAFVAPGLLLFFCLVSINILKAGPVSYRFRHFTVEQGIASNTVRTLYQDSRGFIWFGTSEGLNCLPRLQDIEYCPFVKIALFIMKKLCKV